MAPDQLSVNGQVCDVLDTWQHGGTEFAKVEGPRSHHAVREESRDDSTTRPEGGHISGFVEVPENPAAPVYAVRCEECGHVDENGELVDVKDHEVNHESSARTLAQIHEIKSGHDPKIVQRAA